MHSDNLPMHILSYRYNTSESQKSQVLKICLFLHSYLNFWIYFPNQTFKKGENSYEEIRDCCDNVIVYSANEGFFDCSDEGKKLQDNINKKIKEIIAAEEKHQKLKEEEEEFKKEEKLWKQKEEEERREREEEEKKKRKRKKKKKSI